MGRWEPNARGRLEQSAFELYLEHGFDETTVADIAERAGLSERTFYRHFSDKREVLFWGARALQELFVATVLESPEDLGAIDVIERAVEAAADALQQRPEFVLQRQAIINLHPELQERELIKLSTLATALADALGQRGVQPTTAALSAEAGIAVFKVAFTQWVREDCSRRFRDVVREAMGELRAATSNPLPPR